MMRRALPTFFAVTLAFGSARGETPSAQSAEAPAGARIYRLETLELVGTSRITAEMLERDLGLKPGIPVDDELVMGTRQRLLSLGLFKSALLLMRKGSAPGLARLVVEVEDDETVLGDWGIGGEAGLTYGEPRAEQDPTQSPPLGYRLELVSRNFLGDLHRASMFADIDGKGSVRGAGMAYGFPRFALEDVQFDASVSVFDISHRYLDVMGFGSRGEALWSKEVGELSKFQYGIAMYLNRKPRFAVPSFPSTVAGPKISFNKETRLLSFFPNAGYQYGASLVLAPGDLENSVTEWSAARTFGFGDSLWWTLGARVLTAGGKGVSSRIETRFDVPIARTGDDLAGFYVRLRAGGDRMAKTKLVGSAAIFGLRYHSFGFIAELAFKITKTPKEIEPLLGEGGMRDD